MPAFNIPTRYDFTESDSKTYAAFSKSNPVKNPDGISKRRAVKAMKEVAKLLRSVTPTPQLVLGSPSQLLMIGEGAMSVGSSYKYCNITVSCYAPGSYWNQSLNACMFNVWVSPAHGYGHWSDKVSIDITDPDDIHLQVLGAINDGVKQVSGIGGYTFTPKHIDTLINDSEYKGFKRVVLAKNEWLTDEQVEKLSLDEDEYVQLALALNPSVSESVRSRIIEQEEVRASDESRRVRPWVRHAMKMNKTVKH